MNHADITALQLQAARRFQPQQAAADHYGLHTRARTLEHAPRVVQIAEGEDVLLIYARDGRDEGRAAGGDQQLVVLDDTAVIARDGSLLRINIGDAHTQLQTDMILLIPIEPVDGDVVHVLFTGQYGRQQNTVVVDMSLVAEECQTAASTLESAPRRPHRPYRFQSPLDVSCVHLTLLHTDGTLLVVRFS